MLSEKQKSALDQLLGGANLLPLVTFAALRDKGYVIADQGIARKRGFTGAAITAEGRAALAAPTA